MTDNKHLARGFDDYLKFGVSYLLFILPLLMIYFISPKTISQADLLIGGEKNKTDSGNYTMSANVWNDINLDYDVENERIEPISKPSKVVFEDRNFSIMLDSLYLRTDQYIDVPVEIIGKVSKDPSMKNNEFSIVRPMLSCCSADAEWIGLVCINNTEIKIDKDVWAKIVGKVRIIDGKDGKMPGIEVQEVTLVDKPKNEFVYPY